MGPVHVKGKEEPIYRRFDTSGSALKDFRLVEEIEADTFAAKSTENLVTVLLNSSLDWKPATGEGLNMLTWP